MDATSWFTLEGDPSTTVLFPFITLTGDMIAPADRPERVRYPGVDGVGLWFSGSCGSPFTMESLCDYATQTAARTAFASYVAKIGSKLDLYKNGILWGTVAVHDVTLKRVRTVATTVNGVNVTSGSAAALLTATWNIETLVTS
jgi:hypothetical protein